MSDRHTARPAPAEPLEVLIVDDEPGSRAGLAAAVAHLGHSFRVARNGAEALSLHQREKADVILSDWEMPVLDGLALCKAVRESEGLASDRAASHAYTYFMFVSGSGDKTHFIEGMQAGADDYMTKPVDLDELDVRLEAARRVITLYRRLETNNARLRRDSARFFRAARTDPLTTISNRLRLEEDLGELESRAVRYGHRYCAALCDIDRFKAYNDRFGHLAGDEVLRKIARTIRRELRRGDSFYRYGGEEFLAILPEQTLVEGAAIMDRVRTAVEALDIAHAPGAGQLHVTISVGIAEMSATSNGGTRGWLARADMALYAAKAHGRNRVEKEPAGAPPTRGHGTANAR